MKVILYIVWALFVTAAVLAVVHAARTTKRDEQQVASWPKVQATVTGSVAGWTSGGGGSSRSRRFFPTYQFTGPEGTLFAGESEMSFASQPVPGTPIQVAYNPADPSESRQVSSTPPDHTGVPRPLLRRIRPCLAVVHQHSPDGLTRRLHFFAWSPFGSHRRGP